MAKINKLKEDVISTLQLIDNHSDIIKKINESNSVDWLKEYFRSDVYDETPLETDLKDLIMNSVKPVETDFENAKIIYEMFSKFADSETCNEQFWMGLTFGKYYEYMKYRWPLSKESNYKNHWVFGSNKKRSLFFNGLSRLYWFTKYTYDETLEDPFEITEFCFKDVNTFNELVYRSYSNSKKIRLSLLKALKQFYEENGSLGMDIIRYGANCVSFLGGAYLLDSFTQDELKNKILEKIKKYSLGKQNKFKL